MAVEECPKKVPGIEERLNTILAIGEECVQPEELLALLQSGRQIVAYDGFEPSGRMHVAQGLVKAMHVNRLTRCGVKFIFWVADWFALLNNKMGGNLDRIRTVGRYMVEVWRAAGMDMDHVTFLWSSEEILKEPNRYWSLVMDVARNASLSRVLRCTQIMGRSETDELSAAQILYPVMQCSDIFFLGADICQLGMDQRKVNMLAREYSADKKLPKPVILSHHMIMGLGQGQEKMSKSQPDSAIFMEDSESEVVAKINRAFCPPGVVEANPIMDYYEHIAFPSVQTITIQREAKNGGDAVYTGYEMFRVDYTGHKLHPKDIKANLARILNQLIQPVRDHFLADADARSLMEQVRSYTLSR